MPDLLKNTYTLIACIVTVCTLGSFGGVSLYIIQEGFADQDEHRIRISALESISISRNSHAEDIAFLKSVALSRGERILYNKDEIERLRAAVDELRESR